mmetsp:Transcript_2933/g.7869  ORF Transcript_2933/g.7869 Transcript_2933/m.7869 type:complete len:384 (-) Transcript_2933:155-1306(-)
MALTWSPARKSALASSLAPANSAPFSALASALASAAWVKTGTVPPASAAFRIASTSPASTGTENSPGVRSGGAPGAYGAQRHTSPSPAFWSSGFSPSRPTSFILRRRIGVVESRCSASAPLLFGIWTCIVSPMKQRPSGFFDVVASTQDVVATDTTWPPSSGTPSGRLRLATRLGRSTARAASKRSCQHDWPHPEAWCSQRLSGAGPAFVLPLRFSSAVRSAPWNETSHRSRSFDSTGVSTGNSGPDAAPALGAWATNSCTRTTPRSSAMEPGPEGFRGRRSPCRPQWGSSVPCGSIAWNAAILCVGQICGSSLAPQSAYLFGTSAAPCPNACTAASSSAACPAASPVRRAWRAASAAAGTTRVAPALSASSGWITRMPRASS